MTTEEVAATTVDHVNHGGLEGPITTSGSPTVRIENNTVVCVTRDLAKCKINGLTPIAGGINHGVKCEGQLIARNNDEAACGAKLESLTTSVDIDDCGPWLDECNCRASADFEDAVASIDKLSDETVARILKFSLSEDIAVALAGFALYETTGPREREVLESIVDFGRDVGLPEKRLLEKATTQQQMEIDDKPMQMLYISVGNFDITPLTGARTMAIAAENVKYLMDQHGVSDISSLDNKDLEPYLAEIEFFNAVTNRGGWPDKPLQSIFKVLRDDQMSVAAAAVIAKSGYSDFRDQMVADNPRYNSSILTSHMVQGWRFLGNSLENRRGVEGYAVSAGPEGCNVCGNYDKILAFIKEHRGMQPMPQHRTLVGQEFPMSIPTSKQEARLRAELRFAAGSSTLHGGPGPGWGPS